jgi:hypothetical protein
MAASWSGSARVGGKLGGSFQFFLLRFEAVFVREEPERVLASVRGDRLVAHPAHSWRFVQHDSTVGAYSARCPYRIAESVMEHFHVR